MTPTTPTDKTTQLKKLRNRVYSLIGCYKKHGTLNRGQLYALEVASNKVMGYDYGAYRQAQDIISQLNYEFR